MKLTYSVFLVILFLIAPGCATPVQKKGDAGAEKPQTEGLAWSIPIDTKWITGNYYYAEGKYMINELVPEGETIKDWSELITIQNFAGTKGSPEAFLEGLKAIREKNCPGSTTWNVLARDDRSILYEWRSEPCAGFPHQHEISRILDGNWNRFRIAYTAKVKEISTATRNSMIISMSEAFVRLEQ
jgi:hypothetical protein